MSEREDAAGVDARAAANEARVEAAKAKFSSYTNTYNSLDALCWGIPTRVFGANVILLGILSAHGIDDPVDVGLTVVALLVLGITNWLGATSLHRLWLDHTRIGYWLALTERELVNDTDLERRVALARSIAKTFGDDDSRGSVGYFDHRHRVQKESFAQWQSSTHRDLGVSRLFARSRSASARQRNVIFMRATSMIFFAAALVLVLALALGGSDPMRNLSILARTQKVEHVIIDRLPAGTPASGRSEPQPTSNLTAPKRSTPKPDSRRYGPGNRKSSPRTRSTFYRVRSPDDPRAHPAATGAEERLQAL